MIMDISYEEESLHVVDICKMMLLQASNSCQETVWNTSDKLGTPFKINPVNLNLVMYNCTAGAAARRNGELVETRMRCGNESQVFVRTEGSYDETSAIEGCDASVVVPVLGGANSEANTSDYEQLISGGFLLLWIKIEDLGRIEESLTLFSLSNLNFIKLIYGLRRSSLAGNFDKRLTFRSQSSFFSPPHLFSLLPSAWRYRLWSTLGQSLVHCRQSHRIACTTFA